MHIYENKVVFKREKFDANAKMSVGEIKIEWILDENPDLSYLGEYSNKPAEHSIDRKERGEMGRDEFRYFNLGCGDAEYIEQDYERMERYNRSDWCMLGCRATALVSYPQGNGSRRLETFRSGGLWGIESDSDKKYLEEEEKNQLNDLKEHLEQFNIEWPEKEMEVVK